MKVSVTVIDYFVFTRATANACSPKKRNLKFVGSDINSVCIQRIMALLDKVFTAEVLIPDSDIKKDESVCRAARKYLS